MYNRVSNFLKSNNILAGEQFGFSKNLSTEKVILSFTAEILGAFNSKMHAGGISCDLYKSV
jgi:hypothetical protein